MPSVPVIPETAPFTAEQRAWLNGYLAGLFSRGQVDTAVAPSAARSAPASQPLVPLTILFGSQTGSAEGLAKRAAKEAGKRGFAATILDMAQTDVAKLAAEKNVLIITSTYGDGEPPDNAKALHTALSADGGTALPNLRFSVCALGDTNYTHFCKCGQDFDAFLEKRGAKRVAPRVDCDLDFEAKFTGWLSAALGSFGSSGPDAAAASVASAPAASSAAIVEAEAGYSRHNPYPALVLTSRNLNGDGSGKQVHHVEFALEGSGLVYEAGDALGVVPNNCPQLVDDVLAALECDGEEAVPAPNGQSVPLRRALTVF